MVSEAIVFDLDDTLYLERDYVASGFRHVAEIAACHSAYEADTLFNWLWADFLRGEQTRAFDRLLEKFPVTALRAPELVEAFRLQQPLIEPLAGVRRLLHDLREAGYRLGVITDGEPARQMRKLEALELVGAFDSIQVTGELGREFWKPHPRSFEVMETRLGVETATYIGDNPHKDFDAPNGRGWATVRLVVQGQIHGHAPSITAEAQPGSVLHSIGEVSAHLLGNHQCGSF